MCDNASEILKRYGEHISLEFQQILGEETNSTAVCDLHNYLYYNTAKKFKIENFIGTPIAPEDSMTEALKTGKVATGFLELYGVRFRGTCTPIRDDEGNIIGGLGTATSMERIDALNDISRSLRVSVDEISKTSEEISSSAHIVSHTMSGLEKSSAEVMKHVGKTDAILKFVNEISLNTNLLGVNASIEAARAGVHGLGFSVVADEIRKMSVSSANSVKEISEVLKSIRSHLEDMLQQLAEVTSLIEHQAIATKDITLALGGLSSSAQRISDISNTL